jgi:hypothetical protein
MLVAISSHNDSLSLCIPSRPVGRNDIVNFQSRYFDRFRRLGKVQPSVCTNTDPSGPRRGSSGSISP